MPTGSTAHTVETIFLLLMAASAVAMATKWIKLPYTIALVILGLVAHYLPFMPQVHLTPSLVMLVFLPALLFEASWNLPAKHLAAVWKPVTMLAIVGVGVSVGVIGAFARIGVGFDWPIALMLGAILAATDPVSVVALFRDLKAPERLTTLIEGESLFNDGTGVVAFQVLLGVVVGSAAFAPVPIFGSFVWIAAGGMVVGVAIGGFASLLTRGFDDHLLEITLTTLAAYGSFLGAEKLGVSPVLAVVTAGLVMGNLARVQSGYEKTQGAITSFWEYAAFVANSMLFLLVGFAIDPGKLLATWPPLLWMIGGLLVSRAVVVCLLAPLGESRPPFRQWPVVHWGGLRGALAIALALSLPESVTGRGTLIALVYGCVLFTLLVQGLTMKPLLKALNIGSA